MRDSELIHRAVSTLTHRGLRLGFNSITADFDLGQREAKLAKGEEACSDNRCNGSCRSNLSVSQKIARSRRESYDVAGRIRLGTNKVVIQLPPNVAYPDYVRVLVERLRIRRRIPSRPTSRLSQ